MANVWPRSRLIPVAAWTAGAIVTAIKSESSNTFGSRFCQKRESVSCIGLGLSVGLERFKAIPNDKPIGGPQPPILGASESITPPELGAGGLPVYSL